MSCGANQQQVDAWLDQQLTPSELRQVEQHLQSCDACRQLFDQRLAEDLRLRAVFSGARQSATHVADEVIADMPVTTPRIASRAVPRWSLLMAAAAGFLLALILFPPWKRTSPEAINRSSTAAARVSLIVGSAERAIDSDDAVPHWQPITAADRIEPQSRVRTGAQDLCEIRSDQGDVIRMNCDTEIVVGAEQQLELNHGQIWCQSGVADQSLRIKTPDHQLRVAGTCDVARTGQQLDIFVCAGTTTFAGEQGVITLTAGEHATAVDGRLDQDDTLADPLLATRWIHPLLAQQAANGTESAQRIDELWRAVGPANRGILYEAELRILGDRCSAPLIAYLNSTQSRQEPDKRVKAAKILADVAEHRWATDIVDLLEDENEDVRLHAARGLERLTGRNFGVASTDWKHPQQCVDALRSWQNWKHNYRKRVPNQPVLSPTKSGRQKKS